MLAVRRGRHTAATVAVPEEAEALNGSGRGEGWLCACWSVVSCEEACLAALQAG